MSVVAGDLIRKSRSEPNWFFGGKESLLAAETFSVKASGELRAFRSCKAGKSWKLVLAEGLPPISPWLLELANSAWGDFSQDPNRAKKVIRVARVEFVRAEFFQAMFDAHVVGANEDEQDLGRNTYVAESLDFDWADGDAIARSPRLRLWSGESSALVFQDWLSTEELASGAACFTVRDPGRGIKDLKVQDLMAGMMLTWIDEVAFDPANAIPLLCEAAEAATAKGFYVGWDERGEDFKEIAATSGKKGGMARHRLSAGLKQWALVQAQAMRGADIEIARVLSTRVPVEFHNASANPERLIYEALRASRLAP